jgi:[ribosomal protein S18]-alanine N-acetyltransferase
MQGTLFNSAVNHMKQFEIVAVREEDIPGILRLAGEGGLAPWSEEDYRAELRLNGSVSLQVRETESGKLTGFMIMRLITDKNSPQFSHSEILNITIDNKFRRLALGSALIREAIRISSGFRHSSVWLEVRQSNASAIAFYEKHGFIREYLRKNLYSAPPEDGWVMKLEL